VSAAESGRTLIFLLQTLALLAVLTAAVALARYCIEKRVRASMLRHAGSLVGKRALVVSDLRAGIAGLIRPLGPEFDEKGAGPARTGNMPARGAYPAISNQLISRGRVVRVTGGDEDGYLVQPLEKER
jgi:hypothetical protein